MYWFGRYASEPDTWCDLREILAVAYLGVKRLPSAYTHMPMY